MIRKPLTRPLLAILTIFWSYVALSNVLYTRSLAAGIDPTGEGNFFASWQCRVLQHLFLYPALVACIWAALALGWEPFRRKAPLQLLLGVAFTGLATPLLALAEHLMYPHAKMTKDYVSDSLAMFGDPSDFSLWFAGILNFLLTYGFALALLTGVMLYKRYTASELRFVALERAWSDARLSALRAQLSPHTLFNLLHTIRGQVEWDPPAAQAMIVQLGDLLRRLLAAGQRDFSSLRDELQFARLYLELQRKRFSERLLLDLPEVDSAPPYWTPSLILQPLVENAVVHGVAGHEGPVRIALKIVVAGETLKLQVFNTVAPGRPQDGNGIGLKNVAERLAVHFGDKASLNAGPAEGGEWLAEISMPLLHEGPQIRPSGLST